MLNYIKKIIICTWVYNSKYQIFTNTWSATQLNLEMNYQTGSYYIKYILNERHLIFISSEFPFWLKISVGFKKKKKK